MKQQVKRKEKFGIFFWLAVIALAVIVILINRDNINNTLKQTEIKQALADRLPPVEEDKQTVNANDRQNDKNGSVETDSDTVQDSIVTPLVDALISDKNTTSALDSLLKIDDEISESDALESIEAGDEPNENQETNVETGVAHIYFIKVNDAGHITPHVVARTLPKTSAPLTQSLNILLQGLNTSEVESGLLHLIPPQTELISASIQDGVATLNFTEHFRYNGYGEEGMIAQILQVVYSVTQFDTVDSVKILIEGESIDFLNGDSSIYLGQPIDRDSLSFT